MNVVYGCDENFAAVFAVSVISLFENNKNVEDIIVYLIERGISEKSRRRIEEIAEKYGRDIIILPFLDIKGVDLAVRRNYSLATFDKLFIASQLPQTIDKAIYMDCDTIIERPLTELWNIELSDYYVGMVDDGQGVGYRRMLNIPEDGIYYNSGVMLVNLKLWREKEVEKVFLDYLKSQGGYVPIMEQGVLNATLDGKILHLPLRFNVYTNLYVFNHKEFVEMRMPPYFYSKEEMEEAKEKPVVVHFTNSYFMPIRPWVKGSIHPYAKKYMTYRSKTMWKDVPLAMDKRPLFQKAYSKYCQTVPKYLAILTSKMIYKCMPTLRQLKKWKYMR